jgi:threonine/homoserine/homoserine lactone efflux protein
LTLFETAATVAVLLVTPGPTNTLIALGGAERGWWGALRLIPAELMGYLATTVPLALVGARLVEAQPVAKTVITFVAAAWVLWLAVALWRAAGTAQTSRSVSARRVLVTTLLNPKALVFGLALLPAADASRIAINFGVFVALVVAVASGWAALGAGLRASARDGAEALPRPWRLAASLWLAALAAYLLLRGAGLA